MVRREDGIARCWWSADDALYRDYHDNEWGFPHDDDRRLFEKLCLEGFQSGLSWLTILRKRENFRAAFAGFDPEVVATFGTDDVERLIQDAGIVRHRGKIESTINNARRAIELAGEFGSIGAFVWRHEPDPASRPPRMTHEALMSLATSPESVAMARELKARGWSMVGPTTVYAFMQSVGVVNDHLDGCDAGARSAAAREAFPRP